MWGFASAAMLSFWVLAGVPVVVHLIARRRPREMAFPAVMFLEGARAKLRGVFRLRDLLLMVLRAAAILAAVLVLAGPFLVSKSSWGKRAPQADVVCAVDVSMSMDGKPLARAKGEAVAFLKGLGPGSRAGVFAFANSPLPPLPYLGDDVEEACGYVLNLRARPFATDYVASLRACSEALRRSTGEKAAILFTDLTKAGLSGGRFEGMAPGVKLVVVDSSGAERENSYVESAELARTELDPGEPVGLTARLSLSRDALVRVFLDGSAVEEKFVEKPGGEFTFYLRTFDRGFHEGRVTFSPGSGPASDDSRYFAFKVGKGAAVGVVDGGVYLRSAVSLEGSWGLSAERLDPSNLNAVHLARFDAVVIGDARLTDAAWEAVETYVASGGGLVVFAGEGGLGADDYARHDLDEHAPHGGLFPGRARGEERGSFRLASLSRDTFGGIEEGAASSVDILSRLRLELPPDDPSCQSLATFGDGLPAALGRTCGRGRVLGFAFGCGAGAGELVKRGEVFVPLVREAVRWACGRPVSGRELICGEAAVVDAEGECSVVFPGREERTELRAYGGKLRIPPSSSPGIVRLRTGRKEVHLPCNPDPAESDLSGLEFSEFAEFTGGEAELVSSAEEALRLLARAGRLRLSWLGWLAAALALVAEVGVLRLYGRRPRGV